MESEPVLTAVQSTAEPKVRKNLLSSNDDDDDNNNNNNNNNNNLTLTKNHTVKMCVARDSAVAMGWTVRGSNPGMGEIFRPDRPWDSPSLLCNRYRVFLRAKAAGALL